jgi:HTH-type transcriptional regulator/antitoxin HigA
MTTVLQASSDQVSERYLSLIRALPLRPIRSEADLDRAITMVDALSDRGDLAPDEADYLLVLADIIEKYEEIHHPIPELAPADLLRHLIELEGITPADVATATGVPEETIVEVLAGEREMGRVVLRTLSAYFHVSPSAFL